MSDRQTQPLCHMQENNMTKKVSVIVGSVRKDSINPGVRLSVQRHLCRESGCGAGV
jgi:hypothetical protein